MSDIVGTVVYLEGSATQSVAGQNSALEVDSVVYQGATLITEPGAHLEIRFSDDTLLAQAEGTTVLIDEYVFSGEASPASLLLNLGEGTLRALTGKIAEQNPEQFQVKTALATLGIRGTDFTVESSEQTGDRVTLLQIGDAHQQNIVLPGSTPGAMVGVTAYARAFDGAPVSYELIDNPGGAFAVDPATGVVTLAVNDNEVPWHQNDTITIVVKATSATGAESIGSFLMYRGDGGEFFVPPTDEQQTTTISESTGPLGPVIDIKEAVVVEDGFNQIRYLVEPLSFVTIESGQPLSPVGTLAPDAVRILIEEIPIFSLQGDELATVGFSPDEWQPLYQPVDEPAFGDVEMGVDEPPVEIFEGLEKQIQQDDDFLIATSPPEPQPEPPPPDPGPPPPPNPGPPPPPDPGPPPDTGPVGDIVDIDPAANEVSVTAAAGTVVGITALAVDPDPGDTVSYFLVDDGSGVIDYFTIDAATGVVTTRIAGSAIPWSDFADGYSISIRAESTDGSSSTATFTISGIASDGSDIGPVIDENDAANEVSVTAAAGTVVGITALAVDPDPGDTVSYFLVDDGSGVIDYFTIDAATGVVTTRIAGSAIPWSDFADGYSISIRAESTDGSSSTATFTISGIASDGSDIGPVIDENDAANEVSETAAAGTVVGITALAVDPDPGDTVSYFLVDDGPGVIDYFTIDAATGVVTTRIAGSAIPWSDFADEFSITIRAESTDGSSSTATFTISGIASDGSAIGPVIDENDAANEVSVTAAAGTVVGITALAVDPDPGDTVSYFLVDDGPGVIDYFTIDAATGVVTTRIAGSAIPWIR
jgi:hypothetical protein